MYIIISSFFREIWYRSHYVKSVRIRSFSGLCFSALGLNTKRYSVSLRIQSECGKIRTRKTPNTDTFHSVHSNSKKYNLFLVAVGGDWNILRCQLEWYFSFSYEIIFPFIYFLFMLKIALKSNVKKQSPSGGHMRCVARFGTIYTI